MRVELIGHFKPCMTDIYIHIDARMAGYIRTHRHWRERHWPRHCRKLSEAASVVAATAEDVQVFPPHHPGLRGDVGQPCVVKPA